MGSVWNEELDTAFIKLIKKVVRFPDGKGGFLTPDVVVRSPEGEFKIKKFPSVSIYNYNQTFADYRHDENALTYRYSSGVTTVTEPALPYDMHYQIDFWSEYHLDMNEMTRRWSGKVRPRTTLDVVDTKGTKRKCVMSLVSYANVDELDDNVKIFHKAYSYKIWVELVESEEYEGDLVTEETEIIKKEGMSSD